MFNLSNEDELNVNRSILKHLEEDDNESEIVTFLALNFIVFSSNGEIIKVSNGFSNLLGFSNEEIEGQNVSLIFFNPHDIRKFSNHYNEDEFSSGSIELKHKNGSKINTLYYNNYNAEMHINLMFFIAT